MRLGSNAGISLNGSMSVTSRTETVGKLIEALEKRFRVTNLTGARPRGQYWSPPIGDPVQLPIDLDILYLRILVIPLKRRDSIQ